MRCKYLATTRIPCILLLAVSLCFSTFFEDTNLAQSPAATLIAQPQAGNGPATGETNMSKLNPTQIRDLCRNYSEGAARWLISQAIAGDGGYFWLLKEGDLTPYFGLSTGVAGIGQVFLDLYEHTGNPTYQAYANGSASWFVNNAMPENGGYKWPHYLGSSNYFTGKSFGAAGVGLFLLDSFARTGNQTYLDYANGTARWLMSQAEPENGGYKWKQIAGTGSYYLGQTYGITGVGMFFLEAYARTGNQTFLEYANGTARWLISQAVPVDAGYCWGITPGSSNYYTGQAYGAAGIGTFFLELYRHTGNETFLNYTKGAAQWLIDVAEPYYGGYRWPEYQTASPQYRPSVEDGVAGIGAFLADIYSSTGNATYMDYAQGAARWLMFIAMNNAGGGFIWPDYDGSPNQMTGFSVGTAGISNFFHHLYEQTANDTFLPYAQGGLQALISSAIASGTGFKWGEYHGSEGDNFTGQESGAAGIALALLEASELPWTTNSTQYAESAARWLISVAEPIGAGCRWDEAAFGSSTSYPYLGSGCAGIGVAFLEAFRSTGNVTYLAYANNTAEWLVSQANARYGGYSWVASGNYNYTGRNWGAAGIGSFFLQLFACTGNQTHLSYAKGAAQWLIAMAIHDGGGYYWVDEEGGVYYVSSYNDGTAGIGLFFLDAWAATGNHTYLDYAMGAAQWLISVATTENGGYRWLKTGNSVYHDVGFANGVAGIGYFFANLFASTGNLTYLTYACGAATWLISFAEASNGGFRWQGFSEGDGSYWTADLEVGPAGIGTFFLKAFTVSGNPTYLAYARGAASWLCANASASGFGARWIDSYGNYYTGYINGAAGIGSFLLQAYTFTGNVTYLDFSRKACQWLLTISNASDGGLHWDTLEGEIHGPTYYRTGLFQGTAGIAAFMFQGIEMDVLPPVIGTPTVGTVTLGLATPISVTITDFYAVDHATLSWSTDSGATWHDVVMTGTGAGTPSWAGNGNIPAQSSGTLVIFKITAWDTSGIASINSNDGKYFSFTEPQATPQVEWWMWALIIVVVIVAVIGVLYMQSSLRASKKAGKKRFVAKALLEPPIPTGQINQEVVAEVPTTAVPVTPAEVLLAGKEEEPAAGEAGVHAYRGGRIVGPKFVYKVKVQNTADTSITDVVIHLISYPRDCMKLTTDEMRRVEKIEPKGFRSLEFELQPMRDCVEGSLVSSVVFLDARNEPHTMAVAPFMIKSVCDLMEPLSLTGAEFDKTTAAWAKTGETITFKGEDVRALAADLPAMFKSKNFYPVTHNVQEAKGEIVAVAKGIAIGKYTRRKMAIAVELRGTCANARGDGEITCTGYAEDASMLAACLSEILDEFRKPLVRLIQKTLKDYKGAMEVSRLQTLLKVDAHVLADAVRQQPNLVFLHGGDRVAHYDFIADFINTMRKDYDTVPVAELDEALHPTGKTMQSIVQDLITAGQVRAVWVGSDEIRFKVERHKLAMKLLYSIVAFVSGVVTIIVFLRNYLK